MNLKSLFGLKPASDLSPKLQAIAERIATAEGCRAFADELGQQLQQLPSGSRESRVLRRKLEELARIQKAHTIAADRQRVAEVVKRDHDAATKALKGAESRRKTAADQARAAAAAYRERAGLVARLQSELAELIAAADRAVQIAQGGVDEAVGSETTNPAAEQAAFDALAKAQAHRVTCGESLGARISAHQAEARRLEMVSAQAREALTAAEDDVNLCRLQLVRVEHDQALQAYLDVYLKLRTIRPADNTGRAFPLSTIHNPVVTFASKDRAVLGDRVCGESMRVLDWVLADMVGTAVPPNLTMLAEALPEAETEAPAPLPNPFEFTPGSVQYENAVFAVERARVGAEEHEARLRAEQRDPTHLLAPAFQK